LEGRKGEWLCLHATPLSLPLLPSNGRGIGHCHQWKEIYDLESLAIMLFFFFGSFNFSCFFDKRRLEKLARWLEEMRKRLGLLLWWLEWWWLGEIQWGREIREIWVRFLRGRRWLVSLLSFLFYALFFL
jgi:hypothetical protein